MARNLKSLADDYEDNDNEVQFEKLPHKPKYSKKTHEVEIRKKRQARERARQYGMRQYDDDYYEEEDQNG